MNALQKIRVALTLMKIKRHCQKMMTESLFDGDIMETIEVKVTYRNGPQFKVITNTEIVTEENPNT